MSAEVLRAIQGVAIFPVVSLIVFVVVFGAVLIWASRLDRRQLDRCAHLPLEEGKEAHREAASR
jgi:hypothetical protein